MAETRSEWREAGSRARPERPTVRPGAPGSVRLRNPWPFLSAVALAVSLSAAQLGQAAVPGDSWSVTTGEPLTLIQAIELARQNSPAIREAQANHDAARSAKREAWLYRLPSMEAKEMAVRTDSPADVFGMQLMQERFSFPTFTRSDPNQPAPFDNVATELSASLPLFTGWSLESGIKQAGMMAQAAEAIEAHTGRAVELGVSQAFFGSRLADRFLELAERARGTTAKHVEQAQAFFDVGMLVESDLLQAKAKLAEMDETVIRARNGARLARAGLSRAMGLEQDRLFDPAEPAPFADPLPADCDEALTRAMSARRDLQAVDRKVEAAGAGVTRARGELFPQVGLMGKCAWNDDRLFGTHGDSYTVGAMASWNVWNWGQTFTRVQRAESERRAATEVRRGYRQQVEFEVRQAWQGVEEARARLEAGSRGVEAAEKALAILEDRFGQGVARITDLLDAETMAHQARVREAQARSDLELAARTLSFAVGGSPVPEATR
jgi:outer membrane protein TolC